MTNTNAGAVSEADIRDAFAHCGPENTLNVPHDKRLGYALLQRHDALRQQLAELQRERDALDAAIVRANHALRSASHKLDWAVDHASAPSVKAMLHSHAKAIWDEQIDKDALKRDLPKTAKVRP